MALLFRVKSAWSIKLTKLSSSTPSNSWLKTSGFIRLKRAWILFVSKICLKAIMFSLVLNLEVFKSIISPVSINMMNNFQSMKRSAKRLLHDITMLINVSIIDPNSDISIFHKTFTTFPITIRGSDFTLATTSFRTKLCGLGSVRICKKPFSTLLTNFINYNYILYHSGVECQ